MAIVHGKLRRNRSTLAQRRYLLYALNFVFILHVGLVAYYLSNFLVARGIPESALGLIYATGSILMLVALAYASRLLAFLGNYASLLLLGVIELLVYVGFTFVTYPPAVVVLFFISMIAPALIAFSFDIFLEASTDSERETGGVRGMFLAIGSLAAVAAPLAGGLLLTNEDYSRLFAISALILIPFLLLAASRLEQFRDPRYITLNLRSFARTLVHDIDLRRLFIAQFLLRFFYGIVVIYVPLYLHTVLGMPFEDIGVVIAVALLAFVLFDIPIGLFEERGWQEKDALVIGFTILTTATGALAFVESSSVALWGLLLFITRMGSAIVEVSCEGYFFKQVDSDDTDSVSAYRMLYPAAYIASPLFGTAVLLFLPLNMLFVATAIVLIAGVPISHALGDVSRRATTRT